MPRTSVPDALGPEHAWLTDDWDHPAACEGGPSHHCLVDRHDRCAHRTGGPHERGVPHPGGYLLHRNGDLVWRDGRAFPVGPWHVWRCACPCHARGDAHPAAPAGDTAVDHVDGLDQLRLF